MAERRGSDVELGPPAAPATRRQRLIARGQAECRRVEALRSKRRTVEVAFGAGERDAAIGGGVLAAALAYRIFFFLLPLGLVLVSGLGVASGAAGKEPGDVVGETFSGLVTDSVASAAGDSRRVYALVIGSVVLLYVGRSLLRALVAVHRLAWGEAATGSTPSPVAAVVFVGLLFLFLASMALARVIRDWSEIGGVVALLVSGALYVGAWFALTWWLPHRDARWPALLPGAVLVASGLVVIHVVGAYFISWLIASRSDAYGSLGAAAALLFVLFVLGRLIVASAVLNATIWERGRYPESIAGQP